MIKAIVSQREVITANGILADSLEKEYIDFLSQIGITVFPVSNFCNIDDILIFKWDLIVLTGGGILPEADYNYSRDGIRQMYRDNIENRLIQYAVDNQIPLFGICRGMQKINAFLGGKVSSFDRCKVQREIKKSHPMRIINTDDLFYVNNYHNDGLFLDDIAKELTPLSVDPENASVESLGGKRIFGVQWHPERKGNDSGATEWVIAQIKKLLL